MTLLSRTAENLFWLARYVERAENTARVLETAYRLAPMPASYPGVKTAWESTLETTGLAEIYARERGPVTPEGVIEFLALAAENPSSIKRCLESARSTARAERTALTVEMWEAINDGWLEMQRWTARRISSSDLPRFLSFVKEISLRFDGSAYRTMLRNDAFWFARLGLYMERADNTARILDVKYHVLLPDQAPVGGGLDYYQWAAILRSVSALTSYRWVYRDSLKPWLVAELLILKEEMPRSLASCYRDITLYLDELAMAYGRQGPSQRLARDMRMKLQQARVSEIFGNGLHEFLTGFIGDNNRVGNAIADQYLR
jgi:uncharacterized alpha-E superfamily protein